MRSGTYQKFNDGWFDYYVDVNTGEKKFRLGRRDRLADLKLDDFLREDEV